MTRLPLSFVFCLLLSACSARAQADFELEEAFPALRFASPVDLQHPGDGTDRLFVVEQAGVIRVFDNDASTADAPVFLDLTDRVLSGGEQGLLGLAFHPDYEANGLFFVNYTAADPRRTVVERFRVDPADPGRAAPQSGTVILEVAQPYGNHNGGQTSFGPDGYLYVALGDGGAGGDPQGHGQNRSTLLGAILRIDVDDASGGRSYGIPADNPFVGVACEPEPCREEIYAYGLRNPWRFSFDAETGQLWAADVGQNAYEEIDVIEKGGNYGWNVLEGRHCYAPSSGCSQEGMAPPIWEYDHTQGSSVTGGFVYRGQRVPELRGRYIYADYVSGRIWALTFDGGEAVENTELLQSRSISSFGVDAANELYVLNHSTGRIYLLASASGTSREEGGEEGPETGANVLSPPFPNPSGAVTTFAYTLARAAHVDLGIFDAAGRLVHTLVQGRQPAGAHTAAWDGRLADGRRAAAGLYLCTLRLDDALAGTQQLVRR